MEEMEAECLVPLRDCLLQISQGKIAEKKKQIENLKILLKKNEILGVLDRNSSKKRSNDMNWWNNLNWLRIFSVAKTYIQQEAEKLYEKESSQDNPSSIVVANRNKDKRYCSEFFRFIVKVIRNRHQAGICGKIIEHLLTILTNSFTVHAFGLDYTNVLLKEILTAAHLCLEITPDVFESLIELYCKLITSPPNGWDRSLLAQVLHQLLIVSYQQNDMKSKSLLEFFIHIFSSIKYGKANSFHEFLLQSLMLVCRNVGSSARAQLCFLCESITLSIIQLWRTNPADSFKELMMDFFLMQLTLHHPRGIASEEDGAYACDWMKWKNILSNLYHLIMRELMDVCKKNKYSSSKNIGLQPRFISVAVEVCAQIFQDPCSSIEVTQMQLTCDTNSVVKKRRVEVGFQAFLDVLQTQPSSELLPWLQLLSAVLTKYQQIATLQEIAAVIKVLIDIHLSSNQMEVKTWLLISCQAAVQAFCTVKSGLSLEEQDIKCEWMRLWELGIKSVSLMHQCHEAGHKLLSTLLQHKLVTPRNDLFKLYIPASNNRVSKFSLRTLAIYLENFGEPSLMSSGFTRSNSQTKKDVFHCQVLNWLFQITDDDEVDGFVSQISTSSMNSHTIRKFSTLVSLLSLQDYKNIISHLLSSHDVPESSLGQVDWISGLEQELLVCTFVSPTRNEEIESCDSSGAIQSFSLCQQRWKQTTTTLSNICDKLFQNAEKLQKTGIVTCTKFTFLSISILKTLYLCGVFNGEDICNLPLVNQLKSLLYNTVQLIMSKELYLEDQYSLCDVLPFFAAILRINVELTHGLKHNAIAVETLCANILPHELCDLLLTVINVNNVEKEQSALNTSVDINSSVSDISAFASTQSFVNATQPARRRNRYDASATEVTWDHELSEEESEPPNSDPMNEENASSFSHLQWECADVLALMCKHSASVIQTNDPTDSIAAKLLEMISTKKKDMLKKPETVHLILRLLKTILSVKGITAEHIGYVISTIRILLNKYSKYRTICVGILSLFHDIYPHLFVSNCTMEDERGHILHLLQVLFTKENQGKCNKDVSYALATAMSNLLKFDHHIKWLIAAPGGMNGGGVKAPTDVPVITEFYSLLQSRHLQVSLHIANQGALFNKCFADETQRRQLFEEACRKCMQEIAEANSEEWECIDIQRNKVSSFMHFLCHTFLEWTSCRRRNLFVICQLMRDKKASPELIIKAVKQVSHMLGYTTLTDFLSPYVTYLLDEWLVKAYDIHEFPISLLELDSFHSFFRSFYKSLCPLYLYRSDLQAIQTIAGKVGKSQKDLIQDCLPQITARISSWHSDNLHLAEASNCMQLLDKTITQKVVASFMNDHMDEIVVCLLNMLENDTEIQNRCGELTQSSQGVEPSIFLETIAYLKSQVSWKNSLISFLCQKRDSLQNILLFLHMRLSNAGMISEKQKAILMYRMFIDLLIPELQKGLESQHVFVLTETIHSLIGFLLKEYSMDKSGMFTICIDMIQKICEAAILLYKEDIGSLLPFIVSRLIPLVLMEAYSVKVRKLLMFLMIDCSSQLYEYISCLDPFPNNASFDCIAKKHKALMYKKGLYTLEKEIDHFIQSYKTTGAATLEGLKHLRKQIKSKKDELFNMLTYLQETTFFCEDVKSRRFHSLVCTLVHICRSDSPSKELKIEAGRCLGEIGPVNLSTMILQTSSDYGLNGGDMSDYSTMFHAAYADILKTLSDYLKGPRTKLKAISSQALKEVFKTKDAQKFLLVSGQKDEKWMQYLYPFQFQQKARKKLNLSESEVCVQKIDRDTLWVPDHCKYDDWIRNLVCTLIDSGVTKNEFFKQLTPVCEEESAFCSKILPYLIHAIMVQNETTFLKIVSEHLSSFFLKVSTELSRKPADTASEETFHLSKASVQAMLSVVNHLRLQMKPMNESHMCNNSWTGLNLDFLHIAQASQYCSAYFSAILYTELWCDSVRSSATQYPGEDMQVSSPDGICSPDSSPMTVLNTQDQCHISLVYKILLDANSGIGDTDGIYGCMEIATDSEAVIQNQYMVDNKWDKLLNVYDTANNASGVLKALNNCRLDHTLQNYLQSQFGNVDDVPPETIEYQCECAWRLGQWDISVPERENQGFQEECYKSLQCLNTDNRSGFSKHLDLSRTIVFEDLTHTSLESVRSILPTLTRLQMLILMEDYSKMVLEEHQLNVFQGKWEQQKRLPYADFEFFDPISWLQSVLLKQRLTSSEDRSLISKELIKCLERHAVSARKECHSEIASRCIHHLKSSSLGGRDDLLRWQIEEGKILWSKGEHSIANRLLKTALYSTEKYLKFDPENVELLLTYAQALSLRGKLLEETCGESSTVIMSTYLEKSIEVLEMAEELGQKEFNLWDAHLAVARYADRQYQSIVNYKKSTSFQSKNNIMADATAAIGKLKSMKHMNEDQKKTCCILVRQHKIDEEELKDMENDQQQFLMKAISSYLVCLRGTDAHDLWVFRLTALWFQNLANNSINDAIKNGFSDMETYKFLPLMYQLAARMGTPCHSSFPDVLADVITRIASDHPHHALPVILSMSNADKDPTESSNSKKQNATDTATKERTIAASKLVEQLRSTKLCPLLNDMSTLCDAYISLAYLSPAEALQAKKKVAEISISEPIMRMKNLSRVPVITEVTKVDRTCKYDDIVGIHSFVPEYRLCGGINVPKVIKCIGMDGVQREQLVKGRDDLRQDAVMQQVFHLVNCLLKENNETKKRKLHIRTYKVVPMSRRSGVLQWCAGTQPLSQYLVGPDPAGGAHKKYYPQFWTHIRCQKTMKSITECSSVIKKRQIFDEICRNFPPVFRYFFLENFPEPSAWFERRQSYTKSVASSSIVGYILGLGDRHVNNILIDKYTAEFVHIDFGIAFEKGRILHTPETVPFRMTRDVVDGMGFVGVEGVFKRCCEKTLEVLRNSQDVLLTILEVLLYDPLYDWTIPSGKSSISAPQVQYGVRSSSSPESAGNQEVNKLAERALMRLQQKLQGLEEGMPLSVSGQVNLLIQQARDPNNLYKLYAGWQPYL